MQPAFEWTPFLQRWSRDALRHPDAAYLDPAIRVAGSLTFPGASEAQIRAGEKRLGITFPPSYRAFLQVSNGLHSANSMVPRLWAVENVEWYRTRHADLIAAWSLGSGFFGLLGRAFGRPTQIPDQQYFVYGAEQDPAHLRPAYLSNAIEISEVGEQALLLIPEVVTPSGEWEAWYHASWLPGANRFRSFQELMEDAYQTLVLDQ